MAPRQWTREEGPALPPGHTRPAWPAPGRPRLQAPGSPKSNSMSHGKSHMGFLYHGFFQHPTEATLGEAATPHAQGVRHVVCWGPHNARVPGSLRSRVWNTGSVEGMFSPVPSNVMLTLATGGFITPTLQTRKLRLRPLRGSTEQCRCGLSPRPSLPPCSRKSKTVSHSSGRQTRPPKATLCCKRKPVRQRGGLGTLGATGISS